jgi:hypothetical protein
MGTIIAVKQAVSIGKSRVKLPVISVTRTIPVTGAAGGHWGEGAGIGALVGAMGSGMRMRREQQQMAMQQQGMQQQASSQLSTYNRAVGACLTGRGYTVE